MQSQYLISEKKKEELIAVHPVFSLLDTQDVKELATLMYEIYVPAGSAIVSEGDVVDSVYIIAGGLAEVRRHPVAGVSKEEVIVAKLNIDECIGLSESGFFSKTGIRTATVVAVTTTLLIGIGIDAFNRFMRNPNRLYPELLKTSNMILKMNLIKLAEPFADLQPAKIHKLVQEIEEIIVPPGEYIFHQGRKGETCFMIQEGEVEIIVSDEQGNESLLTTLSAPSIFGEGALLTLSERNASARAKAQCKLLVFHQELFLKISKRNILHDVGKSKEEMTKIINQMLNKHKILKKYFNIVVTENDAPDGHAIYTLKNPEFNTYYQLSKEGWFIWQLLNGSNSLDYVVDAYKKEFHIDNHKEMIELIAALVNLHFIHLSATDTSKQSDKGVVGWFKSLLKK